MSPDGATRRGVLGAALALPLAACGLRPAYAPGRAGARLRGRVGVETPDTPDGFALRALLEDRLGLAASPAATLDVGLDVAAIAAAVTPDGAITRYELSGRAPWRLAGAGGATLAEGVASDLAGYSATGTTVATRAAAADARERLMALLADAIVRRLLLLPPEALP